MIVKAPAVVKLLGEHAVVYGRLALAAAIDIYANVSITEANVDALEIYLEDFGKTYRFEKPALEDMHNAYAGRKDISAYISSLKQDMRVLPYATIASRVLGGFGIDVRRKRLRIKSRIPMQSGLASSAACSTAFAVALLRGNAGLQDDKAIDIARDGERISHMNEGAGRIDVSTAFYGGCVSYSSATGIRREGIDKMPRLIVIDTGPKKSTAETVGHVAELYKADKERISLILDKIDACSRKGIDAIGRGDFKGFGGLMYEDQELLKGLGVSSEKLDTAVRISRDFGALGAKLSGGGGGGAAVALIEDESKELVKALGEEGFKVTDARITAYGAQRYLAV